MSIKTASNEEFKQVVAQSKCIAEIVRHFGQESNDYSYKVAKERIATLQLSTAHFPTRTELRKMISRSNRTWSDEQLIAVIGGCNSIKETCEALGIRPNTTTYKSIRQSIEELKLDTSHFGTKKRTLVGGKSILHKTGKPITDYLIEGSQIDSVRLKNRLVTAGILEYKCAECGLKEQWNNKPIVLHLDHINGVHNDNRLENLRILCPNCHSQTHTYAGRNKKILGR